MADKRPLVFRPAVYFPVIFRLLLHYSARRLNMAACKGSILSYMESLCPSCLFPYMHAGHRRPTETDLSLSGLSVIVINLFFINGGRTSTECAWLSKFGVRWHWLATGLFSTSRAMACSCPIHREWHNMDVIYRRYPPTSWTEWTVLYQSGCFLAVTLIQTPTAT